MIKARQAIIVLLLVLGVQTWLLATHGDWGLNFQIELLVVILLLAAVGPVRRIAFSILYRIRFPSDVQRAWTGLAVGILATAFLYLTALYDHRDFSPRIHDEFSYRIAAQQLAIGQLWMPPHPLGDFFQSMHVFARPTYASRYYPGETMAIVPAVWLKLPIWVASLAWAGCAIGMLYRVVAELIDGAAGLLAALMVLASETFRITSTMAMANITVTALGLAIIWAWLRWRREMRWTWALTIGAAAGWAALTRAQDAFCFALPVGIAMLVALLGQRRNRWIATLAAGLIGILPFVIVALVCDRGITGRWLTAPWAFYADLYEPHHGLTFQGGAPGGDIPPGLSQQNDRFARGLDAAFVEHSKGNFIAWFNDRTVNALRRGLPHPLLFVLVPLGLFGSRGKKGILVWVSLIWALVYAGHFWDFQLYNIPAFAGVISLPLLGMKLLEATWKKAEPYIAVAGFGAVAMFSVTAFPQFNRLTKDPGVMYMYMSTLADVNQRIAALPKQSIVLFKYDPSWDVKFEPVYNDDVPWPDDAPVIRAHDLGPLRDLQLYRYYADRQPDRTVYRYDMKDNRIEFLGKVTDLAEANPTAGNAGGTRAASHPANPKTGD